MTTKSCIACAEQIQEAAKLCRFCNVMQDDARFAASLDVPKISNRIHDETELQELLGDKVFYRWKHGGKPPVYLEKGKLQVDLSNDVGNLAARMLLEENEVPDYLNSGNQFLVFDAQMRSLKPQPISLGPIPSIAITAIIVAVFVPVLGLILGYAASREVRESTEPKRGGSLATGAIVIGWLWVGFVLIWLFVLIRAANGSTSTY